MNGSLKKYLLSLASAFLIWQSYDLLGAVHRADEFGWMGSLFIAALINLYITGIFAFAGFAFPTQKLMPENYYKIHRPKTLKKYYELLKVEGFRKFLLATFWKSRKQQEKYFNGKLSGLNELGVQSRKSEFGHLIPFLLIVLISVYLFFRMWWLMGAVCLLINIVFNLYPIILQRHHRMRIQRIEARMKKVNPSQAFTSVSSK